MKREEYKKIFWRAGQEITPETFIQADNYICAQHNLIRKIINRRYYGLLPVNDETIPAFSVKADVRASEIYIEKLICYGITREGYLIEFNDDQLSSAMKDRLLIPNSIYDAGYVVIRINPFEQTLIEPVENEETPFSRPVYEFDIKELSHIKENELPILKIEVHNRRLQIDRNYIPPCMSILAHEKLLEYYRTAKQLATDIQTSLTLKKAQFRELIFPASGLFFDLDQFSLNEPPYFLIQLLKKIVKTFGFFLADIHPIDESILEMPYNHDDIAETLRTLTACLEEIRLIIGKKEERVIEEDFTPKI